MTLAGARAARKKDAALPARERGARAPGSRESGARKPAPDRNPAASDLLEWYDRHRRDLPWRAAGGVIPDPYRVWLSEIMLQQTTVTAVAPYFDRFLARWPNIEALAAAALDDVLKSWAGLGYYARARNLHACAQAVVERHGGRFPIGRGGARRIARDRALSSRRDRRHRVRGPHRGGRRQCGAGGDAAVRARGGNARREAGD